MTALLTADEATRLRPGEQLVIVRPGDLFAGGAATGDVFVAPQAWMALTGPCPTCGGSARMPGRADADGSTVGVCPNPDCRDGRRIEPLYTECPACNGDGERAAVDQDEDTGEAASYPVICYKCGGTGRVLVGRGSIEVVPEDDGRNWRVIVKSLSS